MQVVINQRATECMYEKVDKDESVTMSVFILSGAELKATASLEGPVAPSEANSGRELQEALNKFHSGERFGKFVTIHENVDFEHLQPQPIDVDLPTLEDDDDRTDLTPEQRRKKNEKRRERAREMRKRMEKMRLEREKSFRDEGDPIQRTLKAKTAGWYRMCVRGTWHQITAEMEMRRQNDLGGMDEKSGHVWTYEQKALAAEAKLLDEDTASQEEGIQDEDFDKTRDQLRKLRRLLSDIQSKQLSERRRLAVHAATNEHSHSRMVLSSLLETILFMAVTYFQIHTIRKWFSGAPVLGR
mmetsp:Transcript_17726/g.21251  ORF Transcript_17726/g.21251 Transcript_17726/m.21251 type:complete len:299 (+) Transcript_17726:2-898(+)